MKDTPKKLSIWIAVLGGLALAVILVIAISWIGGGAVARAYSDIRSSLVDSETVYIMLALWLSLPLGLIVLIATVVSTTRPWGKRHKRELHAASWVSGVFVIAVTLLLSILLVLTVIGAIHPRQQRLTIYTPDISKTYDATPLSGSAPEITYGQLHEGHRLEVLTLPRYSQVGRYENAPVFRILDETGADVTKQYDITSDHGTISILARHITVTSPDKSKTYDGVALTADPVRLIGGTLVPGHQLVPEPNDPILLPGTVPIQGAYRVVSEAGIDVTDQYAVHERFGELTVKPIPLTLGTGSAQKVYDSEDLTEKTWTHLQGSLLEGHSIHMDMTTSLTEVGTVQNEGTAKVLDESGEDVSALYDIQYRFGTLEVQPIPLYISTGSAQKIYDGTELSCTEWTLTKGDLEPGATIQPRDHTTALRVGTVDNIITFSVVDAGGTDVTFRYSFVCDNGTLSVQPRPITIRTGSAQKAYDGTPLRCDTFEIIRGQLCGDEQIELVGTSMTDVGYSENYVLDCTVYRIEADGRRTDVTACYRISFDLGLLRITAS
ncbi:MAG: hypothetical protein IJW45_01945 [Oscillospiraceae bacterium]|nr:hypothetical protein [Oscillospiraceae bacterium]